MTVPEPTPSPPGPLVVYVDDDRGNRVVFEQALAKEFSVLTVADATTALELFSQREVAVLLTDMRMPVMSGDELLRVVKERWPQTIRMVVTAYADIDPILRAINEGLVVRYILKPWVRAELMQVLRWAVEAWSLSRDSTAIQRRLLETERLTTLGSMSCKLVHDLKQPLMSLIANVEVLEELAQAAPALSEAVNLLALGTQERARLRELVSELDPLTADVKTSVMHLDQLVSGLREFSRPRSEGGAISAADPIPIVRHVMSVCQEVAIKVRASIGYEGPGILPRVLMSTTELTQVLINIVANATQAVAARGAANGRVSIGARVDGRTVELKVRDDGVGMPPEVLQRIGTPFFTTRADGTGLGLAQCQRLIGTAGGRMQIESEVGIGTTVTITLPAA